jgi:hypothetical protein
MPPVLHEESGRGSIESGRGSELRRHPASRVHQRPTAAGVRVADYLPRRLLCLGRLEELLTPADGLTRRAPKPYSAYASRCLNRWRRIADGKEQGVSSGSALIATDRRPAQGGRLVPDAIGFARAAAGCSSYMSALE